MSGGGGIQTAQGPGLLAPLTLLTLIKTVDGTGSGLDADLLDGQTGTYYLSLANATGTLAVANGGTGLASYAVGDLVYASAATTLAKLAGVATGNALISGGVTTAPAWGKIGLTTHVDGILPSANGGTGVNNAGTLTNASNTTITGGGTLALGGFALTVPATGTVGLLGTANTWTQTNGFQSLTATSITASSTNASGATISTASTNFNAAYALDFIRTAGTSSSGAHNARAVSGRLNGTIASGQTNSGSWIGFRLEILRNYVSTSDAGTLADITASSIAFGHFNSDGSAPTSTVARGVHLQQYRSSGAIGTWYGIHLENYSTTITPTLAYGIKMDDVTGTTAYAIHTGTGLVNFGDTTDSTSITTGSLVVAGGIGVAKRLTLDGATGKTLRIVNGVANAAVATTLGSVGPTGSTAGDPQGWMRVDINGTDRYIPYW